MKGKTVDTQYFSEVDKYKTEEIEELATWVVDLCAKSGLVKEHSASLLQQDLVMRGAFLAHKWDQQQPVVPEGEEYLELLTMGRDAVRTTIFQVDGDSTHLFFCDDGTSVTTPKTGTDFSDFLESRSVQIEIGMEILVALIGALLSRSLLTRRTRRAIRNTIEDAMEDHRFREALQELAELLRRDRSNLTEWLDRLREALSDLFRAMSDQLRDLFADIFDNLSGWDIAGMLFEFLLSFTPFGWAKRAASLMAPFVLLGISLGQKYEQFLEDAEEDDSA